MLPASTVNAMALGDSNGDGTLDLFVGSYAGTRERDIASFIYWNRKGRGFANDDRTRVFTHSASGCVACDFDLDGYVDLAVANHKVEGDHTGWSAVYYNGPDGFDENRTTRLPTKGPHGITCVGPGSIHDRGPEEYYVSAAHRLPSGARPHAIEWDADVPPQTWVKAQVRYCDREDMLERSPWLGPDGPGTWFDTSGSSLLPPSEGPWMQYRLALGAVNSLRTPRVREVRLRYECNSSHA